MAGCELPAPPVNLSISYQARRDVLKAAGVYGVGSSVLAQVPSPRQYTDPEAPVPELNTDTGRLVVCASTGPAPTIRASPGVPPAMAPPMDIPPPPPDGSEDHGTDFSAPDAALSCNSN